MRTVSVEAEAVIDAPPDRVYRIIADYRNHHGKILPAALTDFVVEEGGVGAGTVIRFKAKLMGRTQAARQRVEEPEPGRVLSEHDLGRDLVTTFTVTPSNGGTGLRIASTLQTGGLQGFVESLVLPRILSPMYREEIANIEHYAKAHPDI